MNALVVIPTYNERENIQRLVPVILGLPQEFDILVIDDASPDGTGEAIDELARQNPGRVRAMHRAGKQGLGSAYVAGFKFALSQTYDLIFQMDADFQHDPLDLPRFAAAAQEADVVIGSRYVEGGATTDWSLFRRMISQGGAMYTRALLGLPYRDVTTGYRCFRRQVLQNLNLDEVTTTGFGFQVEMLYRCYQMGARVVEMPIVFHARRVGESKMNSSIFVEAMALVWRLRRDDGHHRPPSVSTMGH
ncbi:MAG: polyprenol monophosphomannose synthase [Anaerolineae bacterium]